MPVFSVLERQLYRPYSTRSTIPGRRVPPNGAAALRWIVEIKGEERPDDAKKAVAAQRWVRAVNRDGRHGLWEYRYLRNPADLARALSERTGFATPVALS